MLDVLTLRKAFTVYFDEMHRCERAKTYWALLHIVVCLPDICGALESKKGEVKGGKQYKEWCRRYLRDPMLLPDERYDMRCKVLHQGRAKAHIESVGRYTSFEFGQPGADGTVDHLRTVGKTLHLDVGQMANEMRRGIEQWFDYLEANPSGPEATNVAEHLPSLVRVEMVPYPSQASPGNFVLMAKTN